MKTIKLLFYILALLSIASCSLEKRHYMPGYSINWKNKQSQSPEQNKTDIVTIITNETSDSDKYPITSSEDNSIYLPSKPILINNLRDTCDVIELKDNSKIRVKIIEIRKTDITYKICGNPSDSSLIINKSEVAGIDFINGLKGEFDSAGKLKPKKETSLEEQITFADNLPNTDYQNKDSNLYYSKKIIVLSTVKYRQNKLYLNPKQLWVVLKEKNNADINKLVKESKKAYLNQCLSLLIIPLAVIMVNVPLMAVWFISIPATAVLGIVILCLFAIILLATSATHAKRRKNSANLKAIRLYNENILK